MSGTATSELTSALRGFGVDRSSPIPLYFQVSGFIEQAIESGQIPNGSLFANEIQLAEQLGLSRPTVRRAMQDLVDKGLIVRRRGIGTRVVQPKVRRPLELSSLFDDLAGSGQKRQPRSSRSPRSLPTTRSPSSWASPSTPRCSGWCGCAVPRATRSPR